MDYAALSTRNNKTYRMPMIEGILGLRSLPLHMTLSITELCREKGGGYCHSATASQTCNIAAALGAANSVYLCLIICKTI